MSRRDCRICCGRGIVRLPEFQKISYVAAESLDEIQTIKNSIREFPCPECSTKIKEEQVVVVQAQHTISTYDMAMARDPEYQRHVRRELAYDIGRFLLDNNYIAIQHYPVNKHQCTQRVVAKVGVVTPSAVGRIEDRVKGAAAGMVAKILTTAKELIANYGSYYGAESIPKGAAYDAINDAIRRHENDPIS